MKYSSVKYTVYSEAQVIEGLKKLNLLKAAPTRWVSHGQTTKGLISRFQPLVDSLNTMIMKDQKPKTVGIHDELLKPKTFLMLSVVADVLVPNNRFFMFLQRKTLIYADISHKEQELQEFIDDLKKNIKEPFLRDALIELKSVVTVDDPIFLADDAFNISARHTEEEQFQMVNTLTMFYGSQQSFSFEGRKNIASSLIDSDSITKEVIQFFLRNSKFRSNTSKINASKRLRISSEKEK